ncbi:predicted protein [Brucella suis bv. 5 str. 513]|nr:predicted protein [Brucella suis bv. 5 str. 513]
MTLNFYYKLNKVLCELPATRNIKKRPGNIRGAARLLGGERGIKPRCRAVRPVIGKTRLAGTRPPEHFLSQKCPALPCAKPVKALISLRPNAH